MTTTKIWNQVLPARTEELLHDLRAAVQATPQGGPGNPVPPERRTAWTRLASYVAALVDAGWTVQAVARTLGVTHQAVTNITRTYPVDTALLVNLPPAPPAPTWPEPPPSRSRTAVPLPLEIRVKLLELREMSRNTRGQIRGTERELLPDWQASREFATRIAELVSDGPYTLYSVARDLGMKRSAVRRRLARHGFAEFAPSAAPKNTTPSA